MGTPYHHYIIADETIIPKGQEKYYSEKVVRLPCYQPNDRKRIVAAERPTRREAGLPDDAFCSRLVRSYKRSIERKKIVTGIQSTVFEIRKRTAQQDPDG